MQEILGQGKKRKSAEGGQFSKKGGLLRPGGLKSGQGREERPKGSPKGGKRWGKEMRKVGVSLREPGDNSEKRRIRRIGGKDGTEMGWF